MTYKNQETKTRKGSRGELNYGNVITTEEKNVMNNGDKKQKKIKRWLSGGICGTSKIAERAPARAKPARCGGKSSAS